MGREIALEVGRVLRRARRARGLTLRGLRGLSQGEFNPSAVAGYERGERQISLQRFVDLARVYGIPPERLAAEVVREVEGRPPVVIDLARLEQLEEPLRTPVVGFVREVRSIREEEAVEPVRLRAGDLQVLATASGFRAEEFLDRIRPALRST